MVLAKVSSLSFQLTRYSHLTAGEVCGEWVTWSAQFNIQSTAGQALFQCFVYVSLAVGFAISAAALVQLYAPYACHTGIPEIKAVSLQFTVPRSEVDTDRKDWCMW